MYDQPSGPQEVAPDVGLAQSLEAQHADAVRFAERAETEAAAWRRTQQMCEAALSQIKQVQGPQTQAAYADAVNVR